MGPTTKHARKLMPSDEEFRYIDQKEWFNSAMILLETRYSRYVLEGLVQSVGSSIASLVSHPTAY